MASSIVLTPLSPYENPVPTGLSIKSKLPASTQESLVEVTSKSLPICEILKGPFSRKNPNRLLAPGPPLSQIISGLD